MSSRATHVPLMSAIALMLAGPPAVAQSSSFYSRLDDAQAVYLTGERFAVRGDGVADDTADIQAAIDKVQETTGEGVVLVPSGRYRVTTTIYVWGGIRLIGYGAARPVFVLGPNTPGYGDPSQEKYMVLFSGGRPGAGGAGRGGGRDTAPAGRGGAVPLESRAGGVVWLPVSDWRVNQQALTKPAAQFVSPDGTAFLTTGQDFLDGAVSFGIKSSGQLRSFGLAPARPGQLAYATDEADQTTWSGRVGPDGALSDMKVFAYQGGEGVAVDAKGNVYIAAGQIDVYDPSGRPIETIDVPERPTHLAFGGRDRRTLFIAARTSLYSVRTNVAGR